eukprot:4736232-Amphidinium_carterae.1
MNAQGPGSQGVQRLQPSQHIALKNLETYIGKTKGSPLIWIQTRSCSFARTFGQEDHVRFCPT